MHHYQQCPVIGVNQQLDNRRSQLHKAFDDLAKQLVNRCKKVILCFILCFKRGLVNIVWHAQIVEQCTYCLLLLVIHY